MREYGISYNDAPAEPYSFVGYANVAFANLDNCKSTTEYVFLAQGGAIT